MDYTGTELPINFCTRSEMDITTVFETVIPGSNPGRCTLNVSYETRL